jgi:hypothetical protein
VGGRTRVSGAQGPGGAGSAQLPRRENARVAVGKETDEMTHGRSFTAEEACRIGEQVGIDWGAAPFDVEQFRRGLEVELEHPLRDASTNVTDDDPVVTAKIPLAHLNEFADYTRLERMEDEAKRELG